MLDTGVSRWTKLSLCYCECSNTKFRVKLKKCVMKLQQLLWYCTDGTNMSLHTFWCKHTSVLLYYSWNVSEHELVCLANLSKTQTQFILFKCTSWSKNRIFLILSLLPLSIVSWFALGADLLTYFFLLRCLGVFCLWSWCFHWGWWWSHTNSCCHCSG